MTEAAPERPARLDDRGTIPVTVTAAQAAAGTVLAGGPMRLMGWSLASGAAAAAGQLMDAGQPLAEVAVPAATSDTEVCPDGGVYIGTSIAVLASAGALSGVVWVRYGHARG